MSLTPLLPTSFFFVYELITLFLSFSFVLGGSMLINNRYFLT